jgi:hypothetical protein
MTMDYFRNIEQYHVLFEAAAVAFSEGAKDIAMALCESLIADDEASPEHLQRVCRYLMRRCTTDPMYVSEWAAVEGADADEMAANRRKMELMRYFTSPERVISRKFAWDVVPAERDTAKE